MVEIITILVQNQEGILILLLVLFLVGAGWFVNFSVWPFFTSIVERGLTSFIEVKNKEIDNQGKFTENLLAAISAINTTLMALNNACIALDSKIDTLIENEERREKRPPLAR